jgi:hypothetical protein
VKIFPQSKDLRQLLVLSEVVLGVFVIGSLYITGYSQPLMLGIMSWILTVNIQLQICEKFKFAAFVVGFILIGVFIMSILRPFMSGNLMSFFFGFEAPTAFLLFCYSMMRSV